MAEAQTLKNKTENIVSKFSAYLLMVAGKISMFVDRHVEKSLSYTSNNNTSHNNSDGYEQ